MISLFVYYLICFVLFVPLFCFQYGNFRFKKTISKFADDNPTMPLKSGICIKLLILCVVFFICFSFAMEILVGQVILDLIFGDLVSGLAEVSESIIATSGLLFYSFITGIIKLAAWLFLSTYAIWFSLHLSFFLYGLGSTMELYQPGRIYTTINVFLLVVDLAIFIIFSIAAVM